MEVTDMAILKGLATAAMLALSTSAATACDDFDEEMALAAARAARLAGLQVPQPAPGAEVAAPAPDASPTTPAGSEPRQTAANLAETVRR